MPYLDLTQTFTNDMPVFPGDGQATLNKISNITENGAANYKVETSMHVGTHMDGPAHMFLDGKLLSDYQPEKFFGRGVLIDARGKSFAGVELLENITIKKGDIVLIMFNPPAKFHDKNYYLNYPEISEAFAKKLTELDISIIGMDTPSPDRDPYKTHKIFLSNNILIIENLTNLASLNNKNFEIIALPAKFEADSAPCRVIAKF